MTRGLAGSTVRVKVFVAVLPAAWRARTVNVVVPTRVGTPVTAVVWISRRSFPANLRPLGTAVTSVKGPDDPAGWGLVTFLVRRREAWSSHVHTDRRTHSLATVDPM
jgi:hypothetical protein